MTAAAGPDRAHTRWGSQRDLVWLFSMTPVDGVGKAEGPSKGQEGTRRSPELTVHGTKRRMGSLLHGQCSHGVCSTSVLRGG